MSFQFKKFLNRYFLTIVMIPTLIGVHWSWNQVQQVDFLVSKDERKELPIILGVKYVKEEINKIISTEENDASDNSIK